MAYRITLTAVAIALAVSATACDPIGKLSCPEGQVAKSDGAQWVCAADNDRLGNIPPQGTIWLNHHDLVVTKTARITLDTNGTVVFVKPKPGVAFPNQELVPIYVSALSPGFNVTGVRACYGIVGDSADTEVHRLRLAQFDGAYAGGGTNWPGYTIKLEDTSAGGLAPTPPAGGFAYGDPNGFLCVDSSTAEWQPCLDPGKGTISAVTGVQIGDADDHLGIMAVGVHYDMTCTPN